VVGVGRGRAATKEEGICRQLTSAEGEKGDPGWANAHDDRKKQVLGKKTTAERRSLGNIPATRATVAMQGAPPKRTASLLRVDALFSPPVKNVFFLPLPLCEKIRMAGGKARSEHWKSRSAVKESGRLWLEAARCLPQSALSNRRVV
jgi:hypothetical protein